MSATSSLSSVAANAANTTSNDKVELLNSALHAKPSKSSTADKLGVYLQGYLKKQKTMKKKYFVLVSNNGEKPARLEYYDSEKKFRTRFGHPKRSIVLKSCFHISQRLDTKQKFVIALYTREDSFCIVLENETEMSKWLNALQTLRQHEESEVDLPRTTFDDEFAKTEWTKNLSNANESTTANKTTTAASFTPSSVSTFIEWATYASSVTMGFTSKRHTYCISTRSITTLANRTSTCFHFGAAH